MSCRPVPSAIDLVSICSNNTNRDRSVAASRCSVSDRTSVVESPTFKGPVVQLGARGESAIGDINGGRYPRCCNQNGGIPIGAIPKISEEAVADALNLPGRGLDHAGVFISSRYTRRTRGVP
jgi:hypothetical protein